MSYQIHALELLYRTERFYNGNDRNEMKKAFIETIRITETVMLEYCPFYMGLVISAGLTMLDECPDYH